MPTPDPNSYAEQWVQAWNAHDIEAVLDHFSDDVVFTSLVDDSDKPAGQSALRADRCVQR
jgi:uncharacterized protein (TIGR02246 family)